MNGTYIILDWRSYETVHRDVFFQAGLCHEKAVSFLAGPDGLGLRRVPGVFVPEYDPALTITIAPSQCKGVLSTKPRVGHHYPTRLVADLPGELAHQHRIFRILCSSPSGWLIDLNVPLAGVDVNVSVESAQEIRVGESRIDLDTLIPRLFHSGPGLQARRRDAFPDWPTESDLKREDEIDDSVFYAEPRFVTHIDDTTIAQISSLYARLIRPGARVLDLMSSWISHLPSELTLSKVTGLGMNRQELEANPALDERQVHDLNRDSTLPFQDQSFEAVVCTVSVEYLADPLPVFEEVRRVLVPGGIFINTFSNRCFPTKAIALWGALHEFERMGLVAHFFHRTGFENVNTWSLRGLPRPANDPYLMHNSESDPVYAVWAQKC